VYKEKNFLLFLISQMAISSGDAFRIVAVTVMIFNISHSSLTATFGFVCSPVLSLLFSSIAGHVGDSVNPKYVVAVLDAARGILVFCFAFCTKLWQIYIVILLLSLIEVFYSPSRRKLMSGILKKSEILRGNSLLNGVSGGAFILVPVLAGILVECYGPEIALAIGGLLSVTSAVQMLIIRQKVKLGINQHFSGVYSKSESKNISNLIFLGAFLCFASTLSNIAFYPFAFDTLRVNGNTWGLMLSVFYGAGIVATFAAFVLGKRTKKSLIGVCYIPIAVTMVVWLMYGFFNKLGWVFILLFLEGVAWAFLGIIIGSELQTKAPQKALARIIGMNDICCNIARLLGTILSYCLLTFLTTKVVFCIGATLLAIFLLKFYFKDNIITFVKRGDWV